MNKILSYTARFLPVYMRDLSHLRYMLPRKKDETKG